MNKVEGIVGEGMSKMGVVDEFVVVFREANTRIRSHLVQITLKLEFIVWGDNRKSYHPIQQLNSHFQHCMILILLA